MNTNCKESFLGIHKILLMVFVFITFLIKYFGVTFEINLISVKLKRFLEAPKYRNKIYSQEKHLAITQSTHLILSPIEFMLESS